jgi:hypothetical protein
MLTVDYLTMTKKFNSMRFAYIPQVGWVNTHGELAVKLARQTCTG